MIYLNSKPIKAVIFDMDGVLIDSERLIHECWELVGRDHDLSDIQIVTDRCLGSTEEACRAFFKAQYGEDFPYETYAAECGNHFRRMIGEGRLLLKTGAAELLAFLKSAGAGIALATSTDAASAFAILEKLGVLHYFDVRMTGDKVEHSKPDPEIFLKAAAELGVEPCEAMVVEDSHNGVRAGRAGGFYTVMVPDILSPTPEMEEKADLIIGDLALLRTACR